MFLDERVAIDDGASFSSSRKYSEKEAFVTGHDGTTSYEILLLCAAIPVGLHLYCRLVSTLDVVADRNRDAVGSGVSRGAPYRIGAECLALLLPMLLAQTSLLPPLAGQAALLGGMLALASSLPKAGGGATSECETERITRVDAEDYRRPSFLTVHRASVYLMTTVAILAVDFRIFPRRFCKTEVAGYGWMDLGAASFVIVAGWSSSFAPPFGDSRRRDSTSSPVASSGNSISPWRKACKKCAPLLVLGIVRLLTTKGLEYQEHASEYGVHWNFFFTLCVLEGLMVFRKSLRRSSSSSSARADFAAAVGLLTIYQLLLSGGGMQEFIENGDRRCRKLDGSAKAAADPWAACDVLAANREGMLGAIGYLCLRVLSEHVGRYCIWEPLESKETGESGKSSISIVRSRRLFATSALLWVIHLGLTSGIGLPTSRRSTNAPFVVWALAHNVAVLASVHWVMTNASFNASSTAAQLPIIHAAVNRHGLAVFFISNIATGLVNLTVDTMNSSDAKAVTVLVIYLSFVCGCALLLDRNIWKLKKWMNGKA